MFQLHMNGSDVLTPVYSPTLPRDLYLTAVKVRVGIPLIDMPVVCASCGSKEVDPEYERPLHSAR